MVRKKWRFRRSVLAVAMAVLFSSSHVAYAAEALEPQTTVESSTEQAMDGNTSDVHTNAESISTNESVEGIEESVSKEDIPEEKVFEEGTSEEGNSTSETETEESQLQTENSVEETTE